MSTTFPVFDCDAHIHDPLEIWDYVPESKRDLVRAAYWSDRQVGTILNGKMVSPVPAGGRGSMMGMPGRGMYNPITIAGPQMNKKIMRRLQVLGLDEDQRDYVD